MRNISITIFGLFLLSACSKGSGTSSPATPNTPTYTVDKSHFFKITFNGKTLETDGLVLNYNNGTGQTSILGPFCNIHNQEGYLPTYIGAQVTAVPSVTTAMQEVGAEVWFVTDNAVATTGTYRFDSTTFSVNLISDATQSNKSYTLLPAGSVINITSITNADVAGTFSCTVSDATTQYPATGSFNFIRQN